MKDEDGDNGYDVPDYGRDVGQVPPRGHMIYHFGVKMAPQAQLIEEADDIGENKGRKQDRQALHLELQLALKVLADCVDQDQVAHNEANRDDCQERARHQPSGLEPEIDLVLQIL